MDLNNLLGRVLGAGGQILNTPGKKMAAGGAAAGILLTETGRDLAGAAVKYGGIAAIGALALHAWQRSQEQGAGTAASSAAPGEFLPTPAWPPQTLSPPVPAENAANQNHAKLLLAAMVNAAKADGSVDAEEQGLILGHADKLALSHDERGFLFLELNRPFDVEPVVAGATPPALAAEIYAVSRIAIGAASPAEDAYLQLLAARLKLPAAVISEIDIALKPVAAVAAA